MFLETQTPGKTETKADPFSLENLIAWLERQPSAGRYDYSRNEGCMLCMYFQASGLDVSGLSDHGYRLKGTPNERHPYPLILADIALGRGFDNKTWTFGTALARAREAQRRS